MKRLKINKSDKTRILLTELLPYEVPMLFSNAGFYNIIKSNEFDYFRDKIKIHFPDRFTLPFNYEIAKNLDETRTLSVIHPLNQIAFINLYEKYDSLMLYLCSKSPFSLRKINKIAKFYYSPNFVFEEEELHDAEKEVEPDILDAESQYIKSYFTYYPIDLIYKFYDRTDFRRLEQRYNYLMEFDISKCFYHIYTHSISWAVKGKDVAKKSIGKKTFENEFDTLMQSSNYNETNGIVVGTEVSRIFAEIILQQIDIDVLEELNNNGFKLGIDYEVRRYVDDYFIYSNDINILKSVKKSFQERLQFFKLYLNPQKTEVKTSPFISNISVGKEELKDYLEEFHDNLVESIENSEEAKWQIKYLRQPYKYSQQFIKKFQVITKRNSTSYDLLAKDVIRFFKSKIVFLFKNEDRINNIERLEQYLLVLIEILFYCYSVKINSNTTFRISQVIVLICKYFESKNRLDIKHNIYSKIYQNCDFVLTNFHRKQIKNETSIETINLILAMKKLGGEYQFSLDKIIDYFYIENKEGKFTLSHLNYFHFVTLLYYCNIERKYLNLKKQIVSEIITRFKREKVFATSELFMLFFDCMTCPYISEEDKIKMAKASEYLKMRLPKTEAQLEISKIELQKKWFMNWDLDIDLERVLKKKEWVSSY